MQYRLVGFWNQLTKLSLRALMPELNAKPMVSPSLKSRGRELLVSGLLDSVQHFLCRILLKNLLCSITGDTPGDYTDLKLNNPDISIEDGTLMINNIQKTNEGYYLCEAVNGIGSGLSAVILISVQGKNPKVIFSIQF